LFLQIFQAISSKSELQKKRFSKKSAGRHSKRCKIQSVRALATWFEFSGRH